MCKLINVKSLFPFLQCHFSILDQTSTRNMVSISIENLTGAQLDEKFLRIYGTPKSLHRVYSSPSLNSTLNCVNPVYTFSFSFLEIYFNIILLSAPHHLTVLIPSYFLAPPPSPRMFMFHFFFPMPLFLISSF